MRGQHVCRSFSITFTLVVTKSTSPGTEKDLNQSKTSKRKNRKALIFSKTIFVNETMSISKKVTNLHFSCEKMSNFALQIST